MSEKEILKYAMKLKPEERLFIVEGLLRSVDKSNSEVNEIWMDEAEKRLKAYRNGELNGVPMEKIFADE